MRVRDVEPADIARVIRAYRDRIAKLSRARRGGRPAARALLAAFKMADTDITQGQRVGAERAA